MKTYQHFATVLTGLLGTDTAVRLTVSGFMPLSVEHRAIRRRQPADFHLPLRRAERRPDARP
jgi:hypothetical protein